jgi:anti-sigma factor RsiW
MASTTPLHCSELVALVTEYLEGALSAREQRRIEQHLAGCGNCASYLAQMRWTIRLMSMLPQESIAPQSRERLLAAFRAWMRTRAH